MDKQAQQNYNPTNQPVEPIKSNTLKHGLVIAIIIILVVAVGIEVYWWKTEISIQNWTSISFKKPNGQQGAGKLLDEWLVYATSGQAYLYDVVTNQKNLIPVGQNYPVDSITPDGKSLFLGVEPDEQSIYIYDIDSGTMKSVVDRMGPAPMIKSYSSDGRYAIIEAGWGAWNLYDITKNKIIWDNGGSALFWLPDKEQFVAERSEVYLGIVAINDGASSDSVILETINNGQVVDDRLFTGDNQTSYRLIRLIDGHTLEYEKDTFSKPIPTNSVAQDQDSVYWTNIYENSTKQYFAYDIDSKISIATTVPPSYLNPYIASQSPEEFISPLKDYKITVDYGRECTDSYLSKIDGSDKILLSSCQVIPVWRAGQ